MSLSIGRLSASATTSSYASIRPQSYSVANEAEVSAAYTESVQQASGVSGPIGGADPVQYPNAQTVAGVSGAHEVEQAYNAVASAFEGATTSYGADLVGTSYGVVGSNIDVYA